MLLRTPAEQKFLLRIFIAVSVVVASLAILALLAAVILNSMFPSDTVVLDGQAWPGFLVYATGAAALFLLALFLMAYLINWIFRSITKELTDSKFRQAMDETADTKNLKDQNESMNSQSLDSFGDTNDAHKNTFEPEQWP